MKRRKGEIRKMEMTNMRNVKNKKSENGEECRMKETGTIKFDIRFICNEGEELLLDRGPQSVDSGEI